jgi:hypothetical protein
LVGGEDEIEGSVCYQVCVLLINDAELTHLFATLLFRYVPYGALSEVLSSSSVLVMKWLIGTLYVPLGDALSKSSCDRE